jgi:hypothetical protein
MMEKVQKIDCSYPKVPYKSKLNKGISQYINKSKPRIITVINPSNKTQKNVRRVSPSLYVIASSREQVYISHGFDQCFSNCSAEPHGSIK